MSKPTHEIDMAILSLEADMFKAMTEFKELIDEYVDRFPTIEISNDSQDVKHFNSGFKSLVEGMQLLYKSFVALCQLKSVSIS